MAPVAAKAPDSERVEPTTIGSPPGAPPDAPADAPPPALGDAVVPHAASASASVSVSVTASEVLGTDVLVNFDSSGWRWRAVMHARRGRRRAVGAWPVDVLRV
jgi:hypothetical protein